MELNGGKRCISTLCQLRIYCNAVRIQLSGSRRETSPGAHPALSASVGEGGRVSRDPRGSYLGRSLLPTPACSCPLLPSAVPCCLLLPAAVPCCLLLPTAALQCPLLPATACSCLLLPNPARCCPPLSPAARCRPLLPAAAAGTQGLPGLRGIFAGSVYPSSQTAFENSISLVNLK